MGSHHLKLHLTFGHVSPFFRNIQSKQSQMNAIRSQATFAANDRHFAWSVSTFVPKKERRCWIAQYFSTYKNARAASVISKRYTDQDGKLDIFVMCLEISFSTAYKPRSNISLKLADNWDRVRPYFFPNAFDRILVREAELLRFFRWCDLLRQLSIFSCSLRMPMIVKHWIIGPFLSPRLIDSYCILIYSIWMFLSSSITMYSYRQCERSCKMQG